MGKLWPADATTLMEKIAWVGLKVVFPALYLFMLLSAAGIFKNIYTKNVADAPTGWHIAGILMVLGTLYWAYGVVAQKNFVTKNEVFNHILTGLFMILSLAALAGFVFNG